MPHSFESLSKMTTEELERVLAQGAPPELADLVGWEFEGWNVNPATRFTGNRKFKKGFFGNPEIYADPERANGWGYNMTVVQNGFHEPWTPTPTPAAPRRWCFFAVLPSAKAREPRHGNALVIDYGRWGEHAVVNPVRYLVDYVVYVNPGDKDLMLGKCYFEAGLAPVLSFFLLRRDAKKSDYTRRSHFLTPAQLATVKAFAEVFLPSTAAIGAEDVMWNIDGHLERIRSKRKNSVRLLLFLFERVLPLLGGRLAFSKMTPAARKAFIEARLCKATSPTLRDFARLRALFAAGYYGDKRVHASIGFVELEQRERYKREVFQPTPQPAINIRKRPDDVTECDVCVIGSGAGGAVVAGTLADRGRSVVLLEEGGHVTNADITHDEGRMMALTYKEGGLQTTVDLDMMLLQGQCVGGATVINNSVCLRLRPDVQQEWRELGAVLDDGRLAASFARVEAAIGVRPHGQYADPRVPDISGANPRKLLGGWEALSGGEPQRREHGLFHQNMHDCLGCGYCNFGCPYGRKLSMLETYIPRLKGDRAFVLDRCHAERLERRSNHVTEVHCDHRGRKIRIRAKSVVLACGAIGSSVLLMKSGIRVRHMGRDLVGTRFSFNAGTPMFALFDERLRSFDAMQMSGYVGSTDGQSTGRYLLESHFDPPMTFAASLPGWFETHYERMRSYDRFASAGVLIRTAADARIKRTAVFRDLFGPVEWKGIGKNDLQSLHQGMADLAAFWFAAGARTVLPATFVDLELDAATYGKASPEALRRLLARHITKKDDLTLASAHLQGGNPMSDADEIGVVDSGFRVKGLDNLYVCDASIFPSSVGVNPQLTIMAMADYFAELGAV
jgi:choline dehydrogenase-like flavoprotein